MTITLVDVGSTANDGTGDPLRTAFQTVNIALTRLDNTVNVQTGYVLIKDDSGSSGLVVNTTGNVGVGTTSPSHELEIADGTSPTIRINDTGGTSSAVSAWIEGAYAGTQAWFVGMNTASAAMLIENKLNGPLVFSTNSSEVMRFEADGQLGINKTNPGYMVDVLTDAASGTARFQSTITGSNHDVQIIDQDNSATRYALDIQGNNGATDVAQFASNGEVNFPNLPTSAAGLPTGGLWNDSGTLKIA